MVTFRIVQAISNRPSLKALVEFFALLGVSKYSDVAAYGIDTYWTPIGHFFLGLSLPYKVQNRPSSLGRRRFFIIKLCRLPQLLPLLINNS